MANTPSMEDILSSIRSTVQEETHKTLDTEGSVDEKPAVEQNDVVEDVLDLTAEDLVEDEDSEKEELQVVTVPSDNNVEDPETIDLESFIQQGEGRDMADKDKHDEAAQGELLAVPENVDVVEESTPIAVDDAQVPSEEEEEVKEDSKNDVTLDPDKSDEEVAAEIDALLAEVQKEEEKDKFPKMEGNLEKTEDPADTSVESIPETKEEAVAEIMEQATINASDDAAEEEVDVDALMEEASSAETPEREESASAVEEDVDVDALMSEASVAEEIAPAEETEAPVEVEEPSVQNEAPAVEQKPAAPAIPEKSVERVNLTAMPSPSGLQVAFPAEVLAEALRPLVHDWVSEHLPVIVERLVQEELSKLAEE